MRGKVNNPVLRKQALSRSRYEFEWRPFEYQTDTLNTMHIPRSMVRETKIREGHKMFWVTKTGGSGQKYPFVKQNNYLKGRRAFETSTDPLRVTTESQLYLFSYIFFL